MKKIISENKWKILFSSLITISPILFGIIFWNKLPEKLAINLDFIGISNSLAERIISILLPPIILLFFNFLAIFLTTIDNRNKNQSKKILDIVFWIIPCISLFSNGIMYAIAFGVHPNVISYVSLVIGILFIILGNYLPKTVQNHTIGIRVQWTLTDEDNWNKTHRFAGKAFVVAGIIIAFTVFIPSAISYVISGVVLFLTVVSTILYSYLYYRKKIKDGSLNKEDIERSHSTGISKKGGVLSTVIIVVVVIFIAILMFTGDIQAECTDDALTLKATYYSKLEIDYDDITAVEYREDGIKSSRISGFASSKLLLGLFTNSELGSHTRYTYATTNECIIIRTDSKTYVVGLNNNESTRTLYEDIMDKIAISEGNTNESN